MTLSAEPDPKPIPVPAIWIEPVDIDVDGIALVGSRLNRAAPDNFLQALVGRDLPVDGYGAALPVGLGAGIRDQSCPEDDAVAGWVTGRHACGEGIGGESWRRLKGEVTTEGVAERQESCGLEKGSSVHVAVVAF